ncbi:MAG TPA: thymidylate kinase [Terriglobales bacterium]|nr:thymidylate kinase [Terriglobales bacterium]
MGATSKNRQILISFSGMDGAGKSTQIANVRALVERSGGSVVVRAFWDDVVVGTRFREGFSHKVLKSEKGIGAPGKPVERRDKNVRSWYLNLARYAMYFADALNLAIVVRRVRKTGADVIIFDRYIYDQLANLPFESPFVRAYIALVKLLIPRPDVIFFLDADPVAARARKPEYPVDFLEHNRRAYLRLAELIGNVTVIPPLPLADALQRVSTEFTKSYPATLNPASTLVVDADKFSSTPAA